MGNNVRFSIVIPVFNAEKYLENCIQSVISQEYGNYEIIVVNDGSTDSSKSICDNLQHLDNRIRVFHQENQGSTGARKNAVKFATGEYILSLDADDYLDKDFLYTIDAELLKYHNPTFMAFGLTHVDEKGEKVISRQINDIDTGEYHNFKEIREDFFYSSRKKCINCGTMLYSICTKAIKREIYVSEIDKIPANINYGDDLALTKLILESNLCRSIAISDYSGYCYRENGSSLINSKYSFDKLKKYETSVVFFRSIFSSELLKVYAFSLSVLINQLSLIFESSSNMREFVKNANRTLDSYILWENACKFSPKELCIKDRLKTWVIQKKMFSIFYLYFKYLA